MEPTLSEQISVEHDGQTSEEFDSDSWMIVAACPRGVPIKPLTTHLANLLCLLQLPHDSTDDGFQPNVYWPPISRELHALRQMRTAIEPHLPRCKPWVTIVLEQLGRTVDHCFRFYQLDSGENEEVWRHLPLHEESCHRFERLLHALAHLPNVELWRPVDFERCRKSTELVDGLVARTVAKVFDEYRDDDDFLLWGTIETLQIECEQRLENRRDNGEFLTWSPHDIRKIRVLADRLGCTEPALTFEEMDTSAAFRRAVCDLQPPWPVSVDNEVRQWLQSIVAWCSAHQVGTESGAVDVRGQGPTSGTPPLSKGDWTVETANREALRFIGEDPDFLNEGVRHWADKIKCSTGLISKLPLWQALQKRKKVNRDKSCVRALATDPRFLAEAVADVAMSQLIDEQIDEVEEDERLAREFERSWRSPRP